MTGDLSKLFVGKFSSGLHPIFYFAFLRWCIRGDHTEFYRLSDSGDYISGLGQQCSGTLFSLLLPFFASLTALLLAKFGPKLGLS